MAEKEYKIILHPIKEDGSQDTNINLLPKTNISQVDGLEDTLDSKQDNITPENPINVNCVEGLEERLDDFVKKETKIGDVEIGEGIEKIEDLKYGTSIKKILEPGEIEDDNYYLPSFYDLSMFDFSKFKGMHDSPIYEDNENNIYISLSNYNEGMISVEVPNSDPESEFSIYFYYTNNGDGEKWYYLNPGEGMREPEPYEDEIELLINPNNIIEGYEMEVSLVLGIEPITREIEVEQTLKEKVEDLPNWNYSKEEKNSFIEGKTYNLLKEIVSLQGENFIDSVVSSASSRSKYSEYMWSYGNYILCTYGDNSVFYNPETTRWEAFTYKFVGITFNNSVYIYGRQIFKYNNRTFMANNNNFTCDKCIYEMNFDPINKELILTYHPLSLGISEKNIYTFCVFEWDNKLLCKCDDNNEIYELDLDNYTATLTPYQTFYYTYDQENKVLWRLGSNIYPTTYCSWLTPSKTQFLATNYYNNWVSRIRHIQEGDQEALYDQTITLNEYSLIIERVDEEDINAGTPDGYQAMMNRFFAKDENNERTLFTYTKSGTTASFWKFSDTYNKFVPVSTNLENPNNIYSQGGNWIYVNDELYIYFYNDNTLLKQIGFENETIMFEEVPVDNHINYIVYTNKDAKENEVEEIICQYNNEEETYELILNNTYYYRGGTSWLDSEGNEIDLSNLQILYGLNFSYMEYFSYTFVNSLYVEISTLKEYLDNYKNWFYEKSNKSRLYDIPIWNELIKLGSGDTEIYYESFNRYVRITSYVEGNICQLYISYEENNENYNYVINNMDHYTPVETLKANTWYKESGDWQNPTFTRISTPNIILESRYVENIDAFNAIYGNKFTLSQKIDSISNTLKIEVDTLLKDKVYEKVDGDLVDGQEYTLKEDLSNFFEEYASNTYTTLIYGDESILENENEVEPGQIAFDGLDGGKSISNEGNTKVPTAIKTDNIIAVLFWSDGGSVKPDPVTPISPKSNESTRDKVPFIIGGYILHIFTELNNHYIYNSNNNIWIDYNNDTTIPYSSLPSLTLDSTLIKKEDMLKALLNVPLKDITLKEKLDEIENAPLKDKFYEKLEQDIVDEEFTKDHVYSIKESSDVFYGLSNIYGTYGSHSIYNEVNIIIRGAKSSNNELSSSNENYIREIYFYNAQYDGSKELKIYDSNWVCYNYNRWGQWEDQNYNYIDIADLPKLKFDPDSLQGNTAQALRALEALFSMRSHVSYNQTLEEKLNDFKNWTYEEKTIGKKIEGIELLNVPNWETIYDIVYEARGYGEEDTWDYHIYDARYSDTGIWVCRYETARNSGIYFQQVNIWNTEETNPKYSEYLIFNIDFYDQELGMDVIANTWYAYNTQSNEFEIVTAPNQLTFDKSKIEEDEDFFKDLFDCITKDKSIGIFDIPKWDKTNDFTNDFWTIYEQFDDNDNPVLSISFSENNNIKYFNIYDDKNNIGYGIGNTEETYQGITYKANVWYTWNLSDNDNMIECNTPAILLNEQYITDPDFKVLFDALYGEKSDEEIIKISLEDKINDIKNWEYEQGEITINTPYVVPTTYNMDDFEEGLVYGNISPSPSPDPMPSEPILTGSISNEPTRDGAVLEPGGYVELNDNEEIVLDEPIEIYSIEVATYDKKYIIVNGDYGNDGTGWSYRGFTPVSNMQLIITNINGIQNEEALKEILGIKSITLDEKINEPLENKVYSKEEVPGGEGFNTNIDWTVFSDVEGQVPVYVDNETIGIMVMNQNEILGVIVLENEKVYYYLNQNMSEGSLIINANTWYLVDMQEGTAIEEIPETFEIKEECIQNQTYFDEIMGGSGEKTITLKQKFDEVCSNMDKMNNTLHNEITNNVEELNDKKVDKETLVGGKDLSEDRFVLNDYMYDSGKGFQKLIDWNSLPQENGHYTIYSQTISTLGTKHIIIELYVNSTNFHILFYNELKNCTYHIYRYEEASEFFTWEANTWYVGVGSTNMGTEKAYCPPLFDVNKASIYNQTYFDAIYDENSGHSPFTLAEQFAEKDNLHLQKGTNIGGINIPLDSDQYAAKYVNQNKLLKTISKQYGIYSNKPYRVKESFTEQETLEILLGSGTLSWARTFGDFYINGLSKNNKVYLEVNVRNQGYWYYDYDNNTWKDSSTDETVSYASGDFTGEFIISDNGSIVDFYGLSKVLIEVDNTYGKMIDIGWSVKETDFIFGATLNDNIDFNDIVSGLDFTTNPVVLYTEGNGDNKLEIKVYKDTLLDNVSSPGNYEITVDVNGINYYQGCYFAKTYSYYSNDLERSVVVGNYKERVKGHTWYKMNYSFTVGRLGIYPTSVVTKATLNASSYKEKVMKILRKITPEEYKSEISLENELKNQLVTFNATINANVWEATTNQTIAEYYDYQAVIQSNHLINAIKCEVQFNLEDMLSGNYASFYECNDATGELTIYCKEIPNGAINVKIIRWFGKKLDDIIVDNSQEE